MGALTSRAKRIVNENPGATARLRVGRRRRNEVGQAAFREGSRSSRARTLALIPISYALDALNFFAADARNALGPFVNVYLVTERHWSQTEVGVVATMSGLLGIALQTPIGAAIDLTPAKRGVIVISIAAMAFASLIIFGLPTFWPMAVAFGVLAIAGDAFAPAVAALDSGSHAQVRPRPASGPQLRVRSCREHRHCNRGGRDRICIFATGGLSHGPDLRRP